MDACGPGIAGYLTSTVRRSVLSGPTVLTPGM